MKKKQYTAPHAYIIYIAPQQIICTSLESISSGHASDAVLPDQDEDGNFYLAE